MDRTDNDGNQNGPKRGPRNDWSAVGERPEWKNIGQKTGQNGPDKDKQPRGGWKTTRNCDTNAKENDESGKDDCDRKEIGRKEIEIASKPEIKPKRTEHLKERKQKQP